MIYGITDEDAPVTGPPDAAYTTSAVHFNGSTYLARGAQPTGWASNGGKCVAALWTKLSAAPNGTFGDGNFFHQGATSDGGGNDYINMQTGDTYYDAFGNAKTTSTGWQGILISSNISGGTKVCQIYRGDTDVFFNDDFGPGSQTAFPSISNFWFGGETSFTRVTGDVADFRLWINATLDFSVQGNRRYFVRSNGKPANPSYANTLLGTPLISFIGNSTAFPVNGGSGGSFTLTGSLTNAGTSPTD